MGIQIIDPKEIALHEKKRTVVMNTRKMHAWVRYYPNPGDRAMADEEDKLILLVLGDICELLGSTILLAPPDRRPAVCSFVLKEVVNMTDSIRGDGASRSAQPPSWPAGVAPPGPKHRSKHRV
jgi:hypothetical protein